MAQWNAISSWAHLSPTPEILLFGDEAGIAETAEGLGVSHLPALSRNAEGTPLVSDLFMRANEAATYDRLMYVNSDIILTNDLIDAVRRVRFSRFLMIGRRCDIDLTGYLDFDAPDWEERLRRLAAERGRIHGPTGLDYFVFSKGIWQSPPPFVVGRAAWDNAFVFEARFKKIPVIDATPVVLALHQNHDYNHVEGGAETVFEGSEARENLRLLGAANRLLDVRDATWVLERKALKRAWGQVYLRQRIRFWLDHRVPTVGRMLRSLYGFRR